MERRGRIPVAKFRTQEGKTRSRSRVREPDYNEQDPETDLFTLLEDNIALKEENKKLKQDIDKSNNAHNDLQVANTSLEVELSTLKAQQMATDAQLKDLTVKCTKLGTERQALEKLHKMKVDIIENLSKEMELLQEKKAPTVMHAGLLLNSSSLKKKLLKILPNLNTFNNELESFVDLESTAYMNISIELVEKLVDEFLTLKSTLSTIELQLYEANEKIADLMEHQHQLEDENETLRSENVNLTKVAKLLTENMKESVETSKK